MTQLTPACELLFLREDSVAAYPDDFQIMLDECLGIDAPTVRVYRAALADHEEEVSAEQDHWEADDWAKAREFADSYRRGDQLPPLVADTPQGLLQDGYHRWTALRLCGRAHCDMIYSKLLPERPERDNDTY